MTSSRDVHETRSRDIKIRIEQHKTTKNKIIPSQADVKYFNHPPPKIRTFTKAKTF